MRSCLPGREIRHSMYKGPWVSFEPSRNGAGGEGGISKARPYIIRQKVQRNDDGEVGKARSDHALLNKD